jgi:hypothetical protein
MILAWASKNKASYLKGAKFREQNILGHRVLLEKALLRFARILARE